MTKIISAIVILVVVVLLISSNKKSDTVPTDNNNASTTETGTPISLGELKLADGSYTATSSDSSIKWTGRKVILKNWFDTGTIATKEVVFEIKDGSIVSNKFVVDMTSIAGVSTGAGGGQDKLTTHLKSADFFDVVQFPTSTFVAREFATGSTTGSFIAKGNMTIKGITQEVSIPLTLSSIDAKTILAKGSVDLDRTLWDVRYGSGKFFKELGDNVIDDMFNISFELKLKTI